jgi:hypothetical protein
MRADDTMSYTILDYKNKLPEDENPVIKSADEAFGHKNGLWVQIS